MRSAARVWRDARCAASHVRSTSASTCHQLPAHPTHVFLPVYIEFKKLQGAEKAFRKERMAINRETKRQQMYLKETRGTISA